MYSTLFWQTDLFFTVVFSIELFFNILSHSFAQFWDDGWNLFDLIVVSISVVSVCVSTQGANAVRSVRLVRAFRVMRLFGRLKNVRKIISAIGRSVGPVCNAFVIVLLIVAIYAIMGVQLFRQWNQEAFGNFGRAMYTMFSVTTMDGWQELVVITTYLISKEFYKPLC